MGIKEYVENVVADDRKLLQYLHGEVLDNIAIHLVRSMKEKPHLNYDADDALEVMDRRFFEDALKYNAMLFGETANEINKATRQKYPEIPWEEAIEARHTYAHTIRHLLNDEPENIEQVGLPISDKMAQTLNQITEQNDTDNPLYPMAERFKWIDLLTNAINSNQRNSDIYSNLFDNDREAAEKIAISATNYNVVQWTEAYQELSPVFKELIANKDRLPNIHDLKDARNHIAHDNIENAQVIRQLERGEQPDRSYMTLHLFSAQSKDKYLQPFNPQKQTRTVDQKGYEHALTKGLNKRKEKIIDQAIDKIVETEDMSIKRQDAFVVAIAKLGQKGSTKVEAMDIITNKLLSQRDKEGALSIRDMSGFGSLNQGQTQLLVDAIENVNTALEIPQQKQNTR